MGQNWNKAHDPSKNTHWINYPSIDSPIIDDELNRNEVSVDTIDDRVITLDTTKAEQSDLLLAFKNVSLDETTGIITFTLFNNTTKTLDTSLEKIATNFRYIDDPTDPHYQYLELTLVDGSKQYVDLRPLLNQFEFDDTATIHFNVASDGTVTASVIDGSITESKLQPNFLADCRAAKAGAEAAEADAIAKALVSEGYANGEQNGVPVTSESPYYHNNAKYWEEQAQSIVGSKVDSFNGRTGVVTSQSGDYTQDQIGVPTGASVGQVPTVRNVGGSNVFVMETPTDVGILPHLIVISDTGSTVTATKGSTVITAVETSTGHFECDVTEFGTWTIDAILSGDDAQISVNVDTVKIYTIDDRHFHADITVTYPNDGTDTVSLTDGVTTLYATSSPYTFTVHNSGNWVLNREVNGSDVYTKTITVSTSGQTFSEDIPELLTLKGVQNVLDNHRESALLNVGDEVSAVDKNSNSLTYIIADINLYDTHEVILSNKYVSSAITSTPYDYENRTAVQSALTTIYNDFTDSDKALIKNKTVQFWTGGSVKTLTQKTWLPTRQEVNGGWASYETDMKQFALFTTQANRVKTNSGGTATRWQTSTGASNGTIFVAENGTIDSTTGSCGIAECFHLVADS